MSSHKVTSYTKLVRWFYPSYWFLFPFVRPRRRRRRCLAAPSSHPPPLWTHPSTHFLPQLPLQPPPTLSSPSSFNVSKVGWLVGWCKFFDHADGEHHGGGPLVLTVDVDVVNAVVVGMMIVAVDNDA